MPSAYPFSPSNRQTVGPVGQESPTGPFKHSLSVPRPRAHSSAVTATPEARLELTDFMLLRKIGQGGFGEVYLCKKKDTNEVMAMKIMEKSLIWKRNKIQQIKNERDVLAKGLTDRMVALHYSFQDKRYLYLAMEFCPGGDLFHILERHQRLDEEQARLYMAEMILAVHSLHRLGYIHRDLKPDNFLIDRKGHLKLADFGLTKEGLRNWALTPQAKGEQWAALGTAAKGFSVVGSPDFMAPEVLQCSPAGYGQEIDWWSLGCVFFDMLVGYPPFSAETPNEVFENIQNWEMLLPDIIEAHLECFSSDFLNLLLGFLCEPQQRLGRDLDALKAHPFFATLDWAHIDTLEPLFVPKPPELTPDPSHFVEDELVEIGETPSKRMRTVTFQAYYKHQCRTKEEAARKMADLQARSLKKQRQPSQLTGGHTLSVPSLNLPAFSDDESETPSWVTPMKNRAGRSGEFADDGMLYKTMSTPSFVTPLKKSESPEKQIAGFTFQRKSGGSASMRDLVSPRSRPVLKLDHHLEADEEESD